MSASPRAGLTLSATCRQTIGQELRHPNDRFARTADTGRRRLEGAHSASRSTGTFSACRRADAIGRSAVRSAELDLPTCCCPPARRAERRSAVPVICCRLHDFDGRLPILANGRLAEGAKLCGTPGNSQDHRGDPFGPDATDSMFVVQFHLGPLARDPAADAVGTAAQQVAREPLLAVLAGDDLTRAGSGLGNEQRRA